MKNAILNAVNGVGPKSPFPVLKKIKDIILGSKKPNFLIRFSFLTQFAVWLYFLAWNALAIVAFSSGEVLKVEKNVDLTELMNQRALELEIPLDGLMNTLMSFHSICFVIWSICLLGLVLYWRQKRIFVLFFIIPQLLVLLMAQFYVGGNYITEETSWIDLIMHFTFFGVAFLGRIFLVKKNKPEESINKIEELERVD
ncbi:MAG: hypothetical protein ACI9XP_000053 [Lentimonas sp.]|jgi:hypothetical protein